MPTCPSCKCDFKQRKNGGCPHCGVALQIWKGHAFREGNSPNVQLLVHFEKHVSAKTSAKQNTRIIFQVPRNSARYQREIVEAERLLSLCDFDYDLAAETIDVLFTNKQFYRIYNSLLGIQRDFTVALAIAQAARAVRAQKDTVQEDYFERIMDRPNLFEL